MFIPHGYECRNCGHRFEEKSDTCPNCGARFTNERFKVMCLKCGYTFYKMTDCPRCGDNERKSAKYS